MHIYKELTKGWNQVKISLFKTNLAINPNDR